MKLLQPSSRTRAGRLLRLLLLLSLLIFAIGGTSGCVTGRNVVFVPESDGLVKLADDVEGHVFYWNGTTWERSKNKVKLPAGWLAGSLPEPERN